MKDCSNKPADIEIKEPDLDDLEAVSGGGAIIQGYEEFKKKKEIKCCNEDISDMKRNENA